MLKTNMLKRGVAFRKENKQNGSVGEQSSQAMLRPN